MKVVAITIASLIVVFLTYGYLNKSKNITSTKSSIEPLLNQLEKLGYYRYISNEDIESVKSDSLEAGYIFGWEESGRDFKTDAEELAEGGVGAFLKEIDSFLREQEMEINEVEDIITDTFYKVLIDGKEYTIFNSEEINEDIWTVSTERTFGLINKLLEEASSPERVFILYGGNDLRAIFLTYEMYELIRSSNIIENSEKPIKPPEYF